MRRLYISGPMTGLPGLNFRAFNDAASHLRSHGYDAVNPAELHQADPSDWNACMRTDIKALCDCDALVALPGWHSSRGANLEVELANRIGIRVFFFNPRVLEISMPPGSVAAVEPAPAMPMPRPYALPKPDVVDPGRFGAMWREQSVQAAYQAGLHEGRQQLGYAAGATPPCTTV